MKTFLGRATLLSTFLAIAIALTPGVAAAQPTHARPAASSLLFVQETDGGAIERVGPGIFRLRLDGVSPSVSTFTDRPRRRAGDEGLTRFVGSWEKNGFAEDPPNAALVVHRAPRSRDVAVVTLSHPRYDRRAEELTYLAKPLHGTDLHSLAGLAKRGDPLVPHRFGGASLFIDDSGGAQYVPVTLRFDNVQPGEEIAVSATGQNLPLTWSLLPASGRFDFNTIGSAVLLQQIQIIGGNLELVLGNEGAGISSNFSIQLYLEAGGPVDEFFLRAIDNPSTVVTAQIGNQQEQEVNETQTLFSWQEA